MVKIRPKMMKNLPNEENSLIENILSQSSYYEKITLVEKI